MQGASPKYRITAAHKRGGNAQKILLSQRTFICEKCRWKEDRDINASKNIFDRAVKSTAGLAESQAFGDDVRPLARVAVADELGTIRVAP